MFNKTIANRYIKSNWKMFAIITGILSFFVIIMISVYGKIVEAGAQMPGYEYGSLTSFIGKSYFSGLGLLLPMIFVIIICNKIIAAQVDKGSMAGTLSTPTTRNQITVTNLICFIFSLVLMFVIIGLTGFIASSLFEPGKLEILPYIRIIFGGFVFQFAISGFCFFASCLFNTSSRSLALGAGVAIGFYVIDVIEKLDDSLSFLKYFTINTLFNTDALIAGTGFMWQLITLALIGITGYVVGVITFKKKDLPL